MAVERDFELLDDYLANRLGQEDKAAFEQKLKADAELRNEYQLQQQFIQGIKNARIAELKTMMNNIPVPAAQSTVGSVAGKVALWAAMIAVVGTGIYLYLDKDEAPAIQTEQPSGEQQTPSNAGEQPETTNETGDTTDEAPVVSEEPASSEQKPVESPKAVRKQKSATDQKAKEPAIDVFDPSKDSENDNSSVPSNDNTPRINPVPSIAVEIESSDKRYNFHYQFRDGKLVLYGPFEQNLYEIMEFFGDDNKRTLFLFYNEQYFLLKEDNSRLKPLAAIQDQSLLKKLKEYRNN